MIRILTGDCRETLRELADNSVQCCVTSPPYWGLRSYLPDGHPDKGHEIGLEPTPALYVAHLVEVFREVKRVLREDGVLWLNLGDSYAGSWGNYSGGKRGNGSQRDIVTGSQAHQEAYDGLENWRPPTSNTGTGLKPKDLCGIPWRVAFALQDDGWWLRADCIWAKGRDGEIGDARYGSSMPGSQKDRPTITHEYVFLLSKSERYFYDNEAVKVYHADGSHELRSVWLINTNGYSGAHFAVFPPDLVAPMIKAGTSERGCCPECGAPWERVTTREQRVPWSERKEAGATSGSLERGYNENHGNGTDHTLGCNVTTTGWRPTCDCDAGAPVPCTVLDPFSGAGTTGLVADRLGRDAILCELNPAYVQMAEERIYNDAPLFVEVET
jgi:DNA modification methylase